MVHPMIDRLNAEKLHIQELLQKDSDGMVKIQQSDKVWLESAWLNICRDISRIESHYRAYPQGGHTLQEIASILGVTRERVRQLEIQALKKIKHPCYGRALKAYMNL